MKTLFIIRGTSGSGKSTLAKEMAKRTLLCFNLKSYPVYEADMYFINKNGEYKFDSNYIGNAHKWCYDRIEQSLKKDIKKVFVSNTSTRNEDVTTYIKLAKKYEYKYVVIVVENRHNGIDKHELPISSLQKMEMSLKNSIKLLADEETIENKFENIEVEQNYETIFKYIHNNKLDAIKDKNIGNNIILDKLNELQNKYEVYFDSKYEEIQKGLEYFNGNIKEFAIKNKTDKNFSIYMKIINNDYHNKDFFEGEELIMNTIKKHIKNQLETKNKFNSFLNELNIN